MANKRRDNEGPDDADESEEVEVIPPKVDPTTTAARSRAYKLRRAMRQGIDIDPKDADWLRDFEDAKVSNKNRYAGIRSRISHTEEFDSTAADGDAAKWAAMEGAAMSAPELARQEGRRYDMMMEMFLRQSQMMFVQSQAMCETAFKRMARLEESHAQFMDAQTAMLDAVRDHYLARVDAEAELALTKDPEPQPDAIAEMAGALIQGMAASKGVHLPMGESTDAPKK